MSDVIDGPAYGIIVAAGRGERMDGIDKVFAPLVGRPLVAWTIAAFQKCAAIDAVVVVAAPGAAGRMRQLIAEWRFTKVTAVVGGGASRQASVRGGLTAAADAAIVAVHDAARPLVTPELIATGVGLARETSAALCAVPSRDTVKEVAGQPPVVRATPDRARMWLAQTPQVFSRALLMRAHDGVGGAATDDASLVESLGHAVRVYEGAPSNFKVTTPEDLIVAEALLRARLAP
ncbi:MAG TPA: 2-C-methyl-D-erythritol 4-phosphate cytidylyltransferase [Dehalococcoidia bacterium]|nr:2-C-methyl-D-erythritol 4-phosphate cytidylyltransferase [Dehalococcoidia bacterium]